MRQKKRLNPYGHLNYPTVSSTSDTLADKVKAVGEPLYRIVQEIEHKADQLEAIKATLMVNCQPGRVLHDHGLTYDETKSVHSNLITILEKLTMGKKP